MSFDHERPDPLRPEEWEYSTITPRGATVLVSKVGGGTIGRRYTAEHWHYSYTYRDQHEEGSDLYEGSPTTHADAAGTVADYFETD